VGGQPEAWEAAVWQQRGVEGIVKARQKQKSAMAREWVWRKHGAGNLQAGKARRRGVTPVRVARDMRVRSMPGDPEVEFTQSGLRKAAAEEANVNRQARRRNV